MGQICRLYLQLNGADSGPEPGGQSVEFHECNGRVVKMIGVAKELRSRADKASIGPSLCCKAASQWRGRFFGCARLFQQIATIGRARCDDWVGKVELVNRER